MNVRYTERQIDAVECFSVDFLCTYSHPKAERVNKAFWFYFRPEVESEELSEEEQFAGRVEFIGDKERNCTLRMRDVRERDSGEYRFQFSTQSGETFTGSPGVTLKVTGNCTCARYKVLNTYIMKRQTTGIPQIVHVTHAHVYMHTKSVFS